MDTLETSQREIGDLVHGLILEDVKQDSDLDYKDPFVTLQQKKRDQKITELLTEYVNFYKKKVRHSTICRYLILTPCVLIILGFAVLLGYFALRIVHAAAPLEIGDLVAFVTACVSFISLIIGLLTIITKYFFPENDEQYITAIVEAIQRTTWKTSVKMPNTNRARRPILWKDRSFETICMRREGWP